MNKNRGEQDERCRHGRREERKRDNVNKSRSRRSLGQRIQKKHEENDVFVNRGKLYRLYHKEKR